MSPAIEAAWIAAGVSLVSLGGTVAVAIAGFRNTRRATTQTVSAGTADTVRALDAARSDRLWDKQTATYEETNAYLLFRQMKRRYELRTDPLDDDTAKAMPGLFSNYSPAGWFEIQGRLVTYASDTIVDAYEAAHFADREVYELYQAWKALALRQRDAIAAGDIRGAQAGVDAVAAAATAIESALAEAERQDQALIKLIRRELHRAPSARLQGRA
jgi:hypothetical protein